MTSLGVPSALRAKLGDAASEDVLVMFADAHRLATERFEHRLAGEMAKLRLDMSNLRFDLLKWCFLFWLSQFTATVGIISLLLLCTP